MISKSRSIIAVSFVVVTALVLSNAFGLQRRMGGSKSELAAPTPRTPSYVPGSFTFSTPSELTGHPPSPAFFQQDAEPEISVDLFGNIYVTAIQGVPGGTDLWKSTDKGASFPFLGQPDGAQDHCNPPLVQCVAAGGGDDQIDVSTGGYLYVSSLWLGNVTMSTSFDGGVGGAVPGQKWEVDPAAAAIVGDDRQWVAAYGPQTLGMTYAANTGVAPEVGLFFVKSTDGGKTYGAPVQVNGSSVPPALNSVNVEGNLVVDPYTGVFYTCFIPASAANIVELASSTDGGSTWVLTQAYQGPAGSTARGVFPIMALDRGGNLHLVFTQTDSANHSHVFLTSTANPAAASPSWTSAVQVDNGISTSGEAWVVAGSPGIVDIAWLGSSASSAAVISDWHVFFAQVTNALNATPTISQNQVELPSIHHGSVCFDGGGCASAGTPHGEPGNRDLLEYFRIALDPEGNINMAYADSVNNCDPSICVTNTWFSKQTAGPKAYNPPAGPAPATFATNLTMPNSGGTAEPNAWVDTHNCILGGSIGGPIDFISKDAGYNFTEHGVVLGSGIHGGDFDIKTVPKADGSRPDQIYTADLGITTVHIGKSTDGGNTYFQPGMNGIGGEVSVSSDRMWLWGDRNVPNAGDQTLYLMDHEFTSEAIRFAALTNDFAWSVFTAGTTSSELVLPPTSTLPNTNPGPVFVSPTTHNVHGIFAASSTTTNTMAPPFGKEPNVWEAVGAAPTAQGLAPGPFTDYPAFKGMIDSPTQAPSPAPTIPPSALTYGSHVANIFPTGTTDKAGNIYVAWSTNSTRLNTTQGNGQPSTTFDVWMAASHDGGQNFYGPWKVSSGTGTAIFPWVAAGDAGMVDISFYQSASVAPPLVADPTNPGALSGGPNSMPAGSTWKVMFAQSLNANSREPVFTISQASDHIIHTGSISNGGTFGSSDRSLLDFFNVAIGPDGLANIFNADNGTSGLHINYIRQNGGALAVTNPSNVTCLPAPPNPISVVSRKTHGAAGTFDVDLLSSCGIEDRTGGSNGDFQVVITFPVPVTVGGAAVSSSDNQATADAPTGSGTPTITVNIHKVANAQRLTLTLIDVSSGGGDLGNVPVTMKVLLGDTNCDGFVNSADIGQTKAQSGHTVGAGNFREDVNIDGFLNSADIGLVKSKSGTALP